MKNIKQITLLTFLMALVVISCKNHNEESYHSVMERVEVEGKDFKGTSLSSDPFITEIKTIEVTENGHTFLTPERKSQIESYACSECHTKSIAELKNTKKGKRAHWNIKLNHAESATMNCLTCHNGDDMDNLRTHTNKVVDFNKSFNTCKQCHFKQYNDWTGGAHGKRLKSWAEPRLSNTCVNCHNPHDPHFKSRYPARFNTHYQNERK